MDKILTVVIPTYNMEKYLRKCLDSLIIGDKELFKTLEVLILNDGSKDSSSVVAHEYQYRYPEVFRVIDKDNGNYGSCVNRGLKEAAGKYIKILDADDSFSTTALSDFLKYLNCVDDDLILSSYVKVDENGKQCEMFKYNVPVKKSLSFSYYCSESSIMGVQMHAVTYKTENLRKINYRQTEGISYTDQEWIFTPMTMVKSFSYFDKVLYLYLIGREGQTMDSNVIVKSMSQFESMVFSLVNSYENCCAKSNIKDYLNYKLKDNIRFIYNRALLRRNLSIDFLNAFDLKLKELSTNVYILTEGILIHKLLPFKFVNYYRKKGAKLPSYIMFAYKLLR